MHNGGRNDVHALFLRFSPPNAAYNADIYNCTVIRCQQNPHPPSARWRSPSHILIGNSLFHMQYCIKFGICERVPDFEFDWLVVVK